MIFACLSKVFHLQRSEVGNMNLNSHFSLFQFSLHERLGAANWTMRACKDQRLVRTRGGQGPETFKQGGSYFVHNKNGAQQHVRKTHGAQKTNKRSEKQSMLPAASSHKTCMSDNTIDSPPAGYAAPCRLQALISPFSPIFLFVHWRSSCSTYLSAV